ncbi:MAG: hypothetical protein EA417_04745 [Gammaproteobacteria bacterium]|nr:MAG: hypothetical protein EA417_04745 [Gammaproteobacteria bacterium]
MKVNVEFEMTPEEMRRLLGLPDVAPVNDMIVDRLRDQVEKGLDGTLLRNMMQSIVKGGTQGIEAYQTLLTNIFNRVRNGSESPPESTSTPPPGNPKPPPPENDQGANMGPGNR